MKKLVLIFVALIMFSCGKNEVKNEILAAEESKIPPYDTIAIDSFSNGAISVDIARKIRMSSVQYQDSLKEVLKKIESEKILQKETEEKDKAIKILEAEKKKAEEAKSKSEKKKSETETSSNQNTVNP